MKRVIDATMLTAFIGVGFLFLGISLISVEGVNTCVGGLLGAGIGMVLVGLHDGLCNEMR